FRDGENEIAADELVGRPKFRQFSQFIIRYGRSKRIADLQGIDKPERSVVKRPDRWSNRAGHASCHLQLGDEPASVEESGFTLRPVRS
ncbi:hypothetical protein, partial [Mesorhizobium sp. M7A.F.Ca.MR.362.00.0.0]|uniref:hypothetical protein n=1 Tax=Mesorhizobium sp. M7A.F.Ca.MR.362.00.0.0 TaxID=2496779 RepID=UPI0013E35DC3